MTIALLISAGTEAEAQSGMIIETVYLFLMEEDFGFSESTVSESYFHEAVYDVPEITQAAWEEWFSFTIAHKTGGSKETWWPSHPL